MKNISSSGSKSAPGNQGRQPASILEYSPPHPYLNGGRKIAFYRRLNHILRAIPEEGLSFRALLLELFSQKAANMTGEIFP